MAITAMTDIVITDLTEGTNAVTGTGVFDELMKAVVSHLQVEYKAKRISSDTYPQIYLGALQTAMTQAVVYVMQKPMIERQAASVESQTKIAEDTAVKDLLIKDQQELAERLKNGNISYIYTYYISTDAEVIAGTKKVGDIKTKTLQTSGTSMSTYEASIFNTMATTLTEAQKTALIVRQTKGFDDDAKQKLLKQMLDSWSVAYSVAQDANSIPDTIKVNPIDNVTKSAMVSLGIMTEIQTTLPDNPLGEAGVTTTPSPIVSYYDTVLAAFSSAVTTTDTTPGFSVGTGSTSTFTLYVNGITTAATYSSSTGTLTPNTAMTTGLHVITYSKTTSPDLSSAQSSAFSLTIS
jgi:hypothetical protein